MQVEPVAENPCIRLISRNFDFFLAGKNPIMAAMARDDHFDEIPSIVPERDELASHRKKKRGNSIPVVEEVTVAGTSGGVRFMLVFLTLALFGVGGAGYYFYDQGLQFQESLNAAQGRILQLQNRLNLTDEAAQQSSGTLLEKVDANFTQIDLLWANYRNHTASLAELNKFMEEAKGTITSMEGVISGHSKTLNEATAQLANVQSRLETITSNIAGMDDLDQQLTSIRSDLNGVKTSVSSLQNGLTGRVNSTEQDIESINVYRLQLNQTINSMQDSINALQQRVGQ